uniref:Putative helicase MOV-10 n=1 Tax=Aceria tosichella TaxID=561515 RepID=A0A6G1S4T4_9ACAR
MVSERRREKDRIYWAKQEQSAQKRAQKQAQKAANTPSTGKKSNKAKQHVPEKGPVSAKQIETAKRHANDRKWKQLCDSNNELITKNPEARCSQISKDVRKAVELKRVRSLATRDRYFKMNPDNYHEPLKVLLTAEEAYEHIDMRKFDQKRKRIRASPILNARGQQLYEYDLIGMSKGHPKLITGDTVILDNGREQERYEIERIEGDTVIFKQTSKFAKYIDVSRNVYDISFVQSGSSYDRYIKNLDGIKGSKRIQGMLFEQSTSLAKAKGRAPKISVQGTSNAFLDNRLSRCNKLQRQAIEKIMEASCRPNLYILFGPPGTGKTFTVVEAVIQIYKRNPTTKILICSGSNICVDDLALILHESRQINKMIRLSSLVHYNSLETIPKYFTLEHAEARSYRVVITTNMMASKLTVKYDYIFVDEAGHAHIPETMLPMAKLKDDGCFVLAGDPRQLGPVIKCFEVQKLGLGVSLLERLMLKFKIYARKKKVGYNPEFITKLIDSYRCDPRILNLCNQLFYHDELNCLGKTPPSILTMLKFNGPLVFAETIGHESTMNRSTSRQNVKEANVCLDYLFLLYKMGISPDQIGIITPYVLQRQQLVEKLDKRLKSFKPFLDKRFKISEVQKKTVVNSTSTNQAKPLSRGLHMKHGLNDMDFLERALTQLKLSAQAKQESAITANKSQARATDWHCKIDTVDAFQGNEREVIIISTVRTPINNSDVISNPGFLTDAKRFNVAISRAKWLVIVVGHPAVLKCCKLWKKFAEHSCVSPLKF